MDIQKVKSVEDFKYIRVPGKVLKESALPTNFNHTANYYRNLARSSIDKMFFWAQKSRNRRQSEFLTRDAIVLWRKAVWITNQMKEREVINLEKLRV